MGKISIKIYKNPKYKQQFEVIKIDIRKEYLKYIESIGYAIDDHAERFDFDFAENGEIGYVYSCPKISARTTIANDIIEFWERMCDKFFFEEVAFIDYKDFESDDDNEFYFYHRSKRTLWNDKVDFIITFCENSLRRYNKNFNIMA